MDTYEKISLECKTDTPKGKDGQNLNHFFSSSDFDPYSEGEFLGDSFEGREKAKWSISWSDLMMTMFVMFTILYVYQAGNRKLIFGTGPGENEISESGSGRMVGMNVSQSPSEIYNQTRQAVMDEFGANRASVDMIPNKVVRISIAGDILFDIGNADLKPRVLERLLQVAVVLKENRYFINVVGHTDSTPSHSRKYPTNWELSAARATKTARFLIENAGIPAKRVFISAHSRHQPIRPNTSVFNKQLNRRVEILLMKNKPYSF